jgi:hypothetical protein
MPYKLSKTKKSVMVKKGGKWIILKTYKSEAEAILFGWENSP